MLDFKKDQIFTFAVMPDWVSVDAIYFKVYSKNEENFKVDVFSEFENTLVKGDRVELAFSEEDIEKYKPYVIDDEAKIAKILLME